MNKVILLLLVLFALNTAAAVDEKLIYKVPELPALDSSVSVQIGDNAPDFALPSIEGDKVSLSDFREKKNVVISFVPAAWTPVCSAQWPGYNAAEAVFNKRDTVVIGITTDNIPTLFAWTENMGSVWFPVLSDFWPHGETARLFGVLRSDGTTERAIFVVDKKGVIRYIDVHDINERPPLDVLLGELDKLGEEEGVEKK